MVGCMRDVGCCGLCTAHYWAKRRYGSADHPTANPTRISCQVCDHVSAALIDRLLDAGLSQAAIVRRFTLTQSSVSRHIRNHINNPAWHAKRATWWANELAALTATSEQDAL